MNKSVLFSSKSITWATPPELFNVLNAKYHFTTDVCADTSNAKCKHYYTQKIDGLKQRWKGKCWMNPPYGPSFTRMWVEKAFNESKKGCLVVALLPSRTGTRWFQNFIYNRQGISVEFIKGRLKFSNSKNAAPFDSMVVVFYPYHE